VPLRIAIQHVGWRPVVFVSATAVLVVGVLAFFFVKNDPSDDGYTSHASAAVHRKDASIVDLLKGFKRIFAYRNTWLILLAQGGTVGSMIAFTGLWGAPYLKARYGLLPTKAAGVCSIMIICWAAASPICGAFSDKIGRRKPIYVGGYALAAIGWAAMFYINGLPLPVFIVLAAITSFSCGAVIIGFALGKESVPAQFLGTVSGTVNIGNMIGPMILQPGIGWILDKHWSGALVKGVHVYDQQAFQYGFTLIIGWLLMSTVLLSLTKESFCRHID